MIKRLLILIQFGILTSCVTSEINIDTVAEETKEVIPEVVFQGVNDESFGVKRLSSSDDHSIAFDSAMDSHGNVYITGYTQNIASSLKTLTVWKYYSNGSLDSSFGSGGAWYYNGDSSDKDSEGLAIEIDKNEKLIIAGYTKDSRARALALRLNSNGTLDTSFASSGYYIYSHPSAGASQGERANCLAIGENQNIYLGGQGYHVNDKSLKIWKLDQNGNVVTSFASSGLWQMNNTAGGAGSDKIITCDYHDNAIIFGGYSWGGSSGGKHNAFIGKISSLGVIDSSFGTSGFIIENEIAGGTNVNDYIDKIKVRSDGHIYVLGRSTNSGGDVDTFLLEVGFDGSNSDISINIFNDILGYPGNDKLMDIYYESSTKKLFTVGNAPGAGGFTAAIAGVINSDYTIDILSQTETVYGGSIFNNISFRNKKLYNIGFETKSVEKGLIISRLK